MGRDMIRKVIAFVLIAAMLVGIMPEMRLFASEEDDEYDPIEGTTYQIPWDPITTNYVARRATARYVGVGEGSIYESQGYSSADYSKVRSSKYDLLNNQGINYLYPQGVILGENASDSWSKNVPGIATLLNLGSPLVVAGWTWNGKGGNGGSVASGASHPGVLNPLDNEIFSLQRWTEDAVSNSNNKWYGAHMLQRLLAATFKRSAWFSVPATAGLTKTFTLQSGADYAYQLGEIDGAYTWFMGWAQKDGKRRAYVGTNYWDSIKTFINKSYVSLRDPEKQIQLPGFAQGNTSTFTGDTANGIRENNKQGVENEITVYYMKPVVFATNCEQCFNYYYNQKKLGAKELITGSGLSSSDVITAGSASNNYTLTVKKCPQCNDAEAHKNGEHCHIWLVPGETEISAQIYENGSTYTSTSHPYSVNITNNSVNNTDRYITWADAVFTAAGDSIPKEVKIAGDNGKYEYDSSKTPSYTDIGSDGKTKAGRNLYYFGAPHYNSNGDVDERYQLLVYKHNIANPDLNLKFYINGKRTYSYYDSNGNLKTLHESDFKDNYDYYGIKKFTPELWKDFQDKGTPLTIAQGNDTLKGLDIPADAVIKWISYGDSDTAISDDAYSLLYNVKNPNSVIFSADTSGSQNKGGRLYDITATNIVPNKWEDVTVKVNVTWPDSKVIINYLNINDNSPLKDPVTFEFIKNNQGPIPLDIIKDINGESTAFKYVKYEFENTAKELQDDIKVVKPTKTTPDGYAKVLVSHNKKAVLNVYYEPAGGEYNLGMEFYEDGISPANEDDAHCLKDPVWIKYLKNNYLVEPDGYPEIIVKNGKIYQFVRFDQNGVSDTYIKHDAANRKVTVVKDGKKNEKVKAYYRETAAHFYTIHLVKTEAGKTLDKCSELYVTDKRVLDATGTLKVTLATSGIAQLDGYERDTATTPIDIHGTTRNNGTASGTSNVTYTGTTIQAGYDYDIYIPYKQKEKANVYTVHYMFSGSEMWKEGPYNFAASDYNADESLKKSVSLTMEKEISGTTYKVDTANTTDRYDRHNYKTEYGTIAGSKYKTANGVKKGYDYDIYIPLKIGTQVPEYVLHYYKGTTSNVVYTEELGLIPNGDIGKKKVISWTSTPDSSDIEVSFPLDLYQDGYSLNYTGMGYDKHNGIMHKGTLDGSAKTYTTYGVIEKGYRYDIYIPLARINTEQVTIMYEYVDADNGFEPLWHRGVWVDGLDTYKVDYITPGSSAYKLPVDLPKELSDMGWQYNAAPNYYKKKAWISTYADEDWYLYAKTYTELSTEGYAEYPGTLASGGYLMLPEEVEWTYMKIIIPLTRKSTKHKVNIHYFTEVSQQRTYGSDNVTIYYDMRLKPKDEYPDAVVGTNTFTIDKYYTLDTAAGGYPYGTVFEVDSIMYPGNDTVKQYVGNGNYDYVSAMTTGSTYVFCEKCRDFYRTHDEYTREGTMHHTMTSPNPMPYAGTTCTTVMDSVGKLKTQITADVFYDDTEVDIYVKMVPRTYVPMTIVYFEDGRPNNVLFTEEAPYDCHPEIETRVGALRNGGGSEYAYWQEIKGMPEVVMDTKGGFWEPAYMALNTVNGTCSSTGTSTYCRTQSTVGPYGYTNKYFYCRTCGELVRQYGEGGGMPSWTFDNGHSGHRTFKDYKTYASDIKEFRYTTAPSYNASYGSEVKGVDFNEANNTLYVKYTSGRDTTESFNLITYVSTDTGILNLEPSPSENIVLYIPCKKTNANAIDVKYVTLNPDGDIDSVVSSKDKAVVVKQGDTGFSYQGEITLKGTNGRTYNVTGTGQVLSYKDTTGYAPYKGALADTSNNVGQPLTYSKTGKLGTWTATKPYQPAATVTTDGVIYIPVAPEPDLTVKVRYVVYGETNTVIREDTLPDGLATDTDIYISIPGELKHPTTNESLVPIGTDYDISLYGKETSTFYNVTYKDAQGIMNGTPKDGYAYTEVLSGGAGKVHFIVPYLGFDKTDAVVYIPYEPSTTKVDVKYITIRQDGTWRRTIQIEDEVELERGSNFKYVGHRTLTKDGWTFEVSDDIDPVMSYNGASYDLVRNNPGTIGQHIDYDGFETWNTTEKLYVERATLYIPVHITGSESDEGEEEGTDPTDVPEDTEDPGLPGLTSGETGRTDGLDWGNWCEDPLRPVPDRLSGGLFTGRDNAYAFIYHNTYSVSDAIPSGTNKVRGAINTYPYLAGAKYSTVSKTFNYHIRNTITFTYKYYTASGYSWDWETNDVEDEDGFHTEFEGHITLPTFEEHTDTVTYEFGFDVPGESDPYVTDIDLSVAYLNSGQITDPALDQTLNIGKYTLKRTEVKDGTFTPQALSQYEYSETRSKIFSLPTISAAGGTYTDKDEYEKALAEVKAVIAEVAKQPGEVKTEANKAYADAKINPAQAEAEAAAAHTDPNHAQLWVDGKNYINASGAIVPLNITRTTYDATNTAAIPKEKLNGEYASAFTTDYVYYINELGLAEVDPAGTANIVYVHTPVYTEVTIDCDNIKYEQTKTAGMPSFVLVNGTSDSYGSVLNQNITNDFIVTVSNKGQHLEYPGYGNKDYSGYLMANGNQIAFDCDMWMDVGSDGNPANDLLIPAGMWAYVQTGTESNKGRFYLPEWIKDGVHDYYVRTVAYNNTRAEIATGETGAYGQMTANTWRTFDPESTGWATAAYTSYVKGEFTVVGKLYGLTLTDVNDSTSWKDVFRQAGKEPKLYSLLGKDTFAHRVGFATDNTTNDGTGIPSTVAFDKNLAYYYRFGTFNELGLGTGRMAWGSLPTLKGYNPVTRTEGTLKPGYTWTFKVDTVGTQTVTDDAVISVEPFFSWISLDGKTRIDNVKLYYSESVGDKKYTLTRVGSQSDLGNIKTTDVGSMLISSEELKNTAKLKGYGVSGGPKLAEYLDLDGEVYRYGKFTPSANFKTFSNLNYYGDIVGRGIAKKALADGTLTNAGIANTKAYLKQLYGTDAKAEQELSKLRQSYYFNYRIPKEFYVYPSDKTPSTLKDLKAEKMNDAGYLVVSFRIHSVVNGTEYLYYWDGNSNMWNLETGSMDGTIKRTDAAGTEFTLKNGDVALVEINKDGGSDVGTVLK